MYSGYTENSALVVMETLCEVAIQRLGEVHTGLRMGDLRERYHSEKLDVDGTSRGWMERHGLECFPTR
jgi:hypothetical protein